MSDSPKPPKISVLKSSLESSLDSEDAFHSTTLNDSATNSMDSSLYESTVASLTDPPIRPGVTYVPQQEGSPLARSFNSTTWDYDNYLEKPIGKRAEPHYVSPSASQDYSARGFLDDEEQRLSGSSGQGHSSLGISPSLLASCAYFFGFFGGLVIMVLEKKNLFVLFHAWQSLIFGIFAFLVQICFVWSNSMYTLLWIIYLIFNFFMIVRVIQDAPTQRLFKLPIIGDWCEHRAYNKIQYHTGSNFYRMA